jgi:deoxyadenosine/deoxycytidine kinase
MSKEREMVIVLGGMIGIGKSTYATLLGEHYGTEVFYESVDNNPILDRFYSDPKRYAFLLQVYFLSTRFHSIKQALLNRRNILDRSIYEDALFTQINYEQGNITVEEKMTYDMLLKEMMEEIDGMPKKAPDLFIYLRGSFETVLKRIRLRGRAFEQGDDKIEYYRLLHSRYDDWVFNHYKASEVLVIDADKYDISYEEDQKAVLAMIDQKLLELGI